MKTEKTIEVLNTLITINNDRIEGYETALKETEDQDLKSLFAQFISTSQKCRQELVREVTTLGGEAEDGTKVSGKIFRVWMDFKALLTGKHRKAILNSCKYGEEEAKETYEKVLANDLEYLSAEQQTIVYTQKSLLKAEHDQINALHGALGDA